MTTRKSDPYWIPVELTSGDIPRTPSARNRKIYDEVKVGRRSLREVGRDFHLSHTSVRNIVGSVSKWMSQTLGKAESGDWQQRKAECEYIYRERMELYRQQSLAYLQKSDHPLKTMKTVTGPGGVELRTEEWVREQRANVRWLDIAVKIEERRAKFDADYGWTSPPAEEEQSDDERIAAAERVIQTACVKGEPPTIEEVADGRQILAERNALRQQAESAGQQWNELHERFLKLQSELRESERRAKEAEEKLQALAQEPSRDRSQIDVGSAATHSPATQGGRCLVGESCPKTENRKLKTSCPPLPHGRGSDSPGGRGRDLSDRTPRASPFYGWPYNEDAEPDRTDSPLHWRYALPKDFSLWERQKEIDAKRAEHQRLWPKMPLGTFLTRPTPLHVGGRTYIMPTRDEDIWSLWDDLKKERFRQAWYAERDRRAAQGEPFPEPKGR